MRATIAWWDLTESPQTIETLRDYLADEGIKPWETISGLVLKFWMSDPKTNRWGAVMLWDPMADLSAPLPPNRATELIGYPPTDRMSTDIEGLVGDFNFANLADYGLAFEREGAAA